LICATSVRPSSLSRFAKAGLAARSLRKSITRMKHWNAKRKFKAASHLIIAVRRASRSMHHLQVTRTWRV